eukprot:CAMPEP_0201676474 /NCGR_PEP_ID=MMETSP0494-20130426/41829_1 /ASSEMBLY_ACC=CAM_ASM_000839 /TAXON_ID=420259 /ORGANISM="Thalassiosira gravida, Strain GMp14c1" /LENGTH=30 /DNA_ID= /DNA_START= /DNA_END= /DNA_ORIENTATION=
MSSTVPALSFEDVLAAAATDEDDDVTLFFA